MHYENSQFSDMKNRKENVMINEDNLLGNISSGNKIALLPYKRDLREEEGEI